jgi:hypothetical protein
MCTEARFLNRKSSGCETEEVNCSRATPPLTYTSSWLGAQLSTKTVQFSFVIISSILFYLETF